MKYPHLAKKNDRNATPLPFTDLGAKLNKERFDFTPLNIGTYRVSEDGFEGALVPSFHE